MTRVKRELLRDDRNGKVAGICAGLADYFGWELWLIRIVLVASVLMGFGGFLVVLYIAGWFVLEKKSVAERRTGNAASAGFSTEQYQTSAVVDRPVELKTRVWQRGESPRQALLHLNQQFEHIEQRIRSIETYVTSNKYQLDREISRL
ncbi:MAG TPA: envelope stress response membrane protein PspC [Rheinheimera sp.]|nr:envelope stress response membrane protein PspC [Rheinheimera sp.]